MTSEEMKAKFKAVYADRGEMEALGKLQDVADRVAPFLIAAIAGPPDVSEPVMDAIARMGEEG